MEMKKAHPSPTGELSLRYRVTGAGGKAGLKRRGQAGERKSFLKFPFTIDLTA